MADYGIEVYDADGEILFKPNFGPYNIIGVLNLSEQADVGSVTVILEPGRKLTYYYDTEGDETDDDIRHNRYSYYLLSVDSNTLSWEKKGGGTLNTEHFVYLVAYTG